MSERQNGRQKFDREAKFVRAPRPFVDTADPGTPEVRGLYDPALDKDFLRRRFRREYQGRQVAPDHRGRT